MAKFIELSDRELAELARITNKPYRFIMIDYARNVYYSPDTLNNIQYLGYLILNKGKKMFVKSGARGEGTYLTE